MTALTGRPGALGEATAESMLGVVALIVVREILGPVDCLALVLTGGSGHDVLIPVQQAVVPITFLIDPDLVTATN